MADQWQVLSEARLQAEDDYHVGSVSDYQKSVIHRHGLHMKPVMNDPHDSPGGQIPEPDRPILAAGNSNILPKMNLCNLQMLNLMTIPHVADTLLSCNVRQMSSASSPHP